MKKQYKYYLTIQSGLEKLVKTNSERCEVLIQAMHGYHHFSGETPYPNYSDESFSEISEQRWNEAYLKHKKGTQTHIK